MIWLCAALLVLLAASWGWFFREKRRRERRGAALHRMAADFLRGEGRIPAGVEDDAFAPLQRDLSALADEVSLARENAREHDRQVARLMADISHQMKTPLATLRLYCEMSLEDGDGNADKELLLVGRMEELIRSLLRLEKLRANAYPLDFAVFDLADLARDVYKQFASLYPLKRIEVQGTGFPVRADRAWLREAIMNVVKNACEHTREDGRVAVSLRRGEGLCRVEVEDDGGGVPDEELAGLFRRFSRASGTEKGGCGLGLAITRSIMECHHGGAIAENGREGLRVSLYLPLIAEELRDFSLS